MPACTDTCPVLLYEPTVLTGDRREVTVTSPLYSLGEVRCPEVACPRFHGRWMARLGFTPPLPGP